MNILCKLGFHKPMKNAYQRVYMRNGKHKWHRNYVICERCSKRIAFVSLHKKKEELI